MMLRGWLIAVVPEAQDGREVRRWLWVLMPLSY